MRIFDTFIFFNELDLLECRLRELENAPVHHILVEATTTLQGEPKPMYYADNKERFAAWKDRITVVTMEHTCEISWARQAQQRGSIFAGLQYCDAEPDDLIIFGDVDEIPRASLISKKMTPQVTLSQDLYMFAVDWLHPGKWPGTVVEQAGAITNFDDLRQKKNDWPRIPNGGWHFSWLGGVEAIKEKAASYAHDELTELVQGWADDGLLYEAGYSWNDYATDLDTQLEAVEVNDRFPQWIQDRKCPTSWFRPIGSEGPRIITTHIPELKHASFYHRDRRLPRQSHSPESS